PNVVKVFKLLFDRWRNLVEHGDFVRRSGWLPLGTRAVVALNVDDQCIVKLAQILNCLDDAANFVIGIRRIRRKYIGLTDKKLLFVSGELIPFFDQVFWPWRELRVLGNDTEFLLIGENCFS